MKEIKLVFGKGGKVKILDEGMKGGDGAAKFTEDLAKELGETEERHKGMTHESLNTKLKQEQKLGN